MTNRYAKVLNSLSNTLMILLVSLIISKLLPSDTSNPDMTTSYYDLLFIVWKQTFKHFLILLMRVLHSYVIYFPNLPLKLVWSSTIGIVIFVITVIQYAWKYDISFLILLMRVRMCFSILTYLIFSPTGIQLKKWIRCFQLLISQMRNDEIATSEIGK